MKGGRTAPRILANAAAAQLAIDASMKGGRTAPRIILRLNELRPSCACFNEGGADCPPNPKCSIAPSAIQPASMKGGRTAPRIQTTEMLAEFQHLLQ